MTESPAYEPPTHEVVAVRHGETAWSKSGRHTGWSDIALTAEGRHQAALAGCRLGGQRFALVLTSPLVRAVDTCRLAGLSAGAEHEPDLREWDYGEYDGKTRAEITHERPDWRLWTDGCPGGETVAQVAARADRVIERCRTAGGPVALFAHGHLLRVLAARWVGADPVLGAALDLSTAAVSVLGWERATPVVERWNDTGHLEGGGAMRAAR